jgi:hypothetical protein
VESKGAAHYAGKGPGLLLLGPSITKTITIREKVNSKYFALHSPESAPQLESLWERKWMKVKEKLSAGEGTRQTRRAVSVRSMTLFLLLVLLVFKLACAATILSIDFEDGQIHNADPPGYPNLVPPAVLVESGNHFLRLTASPSDCGPDFATTCPRTRANVSMGHSSVKSGSRVTYSWSMRIPRATNPDGQNNMWFQLAQDSTPTFTGGRLAWIGTQNGRLFIENTAPRQHDTSGPWTRRDLKPIPYDQWVNYSLSVFLTDVAALGRIELSMNGALVASIVGENTVFKVGHFGNTNSGANEYTQMHLQIVDFVGVFGTADYDNVHIITGNP